MSIVSLILEGKYFEAKEALITRLDHRRDELLEDYKHWLNSSILLEASRFKIVRVRIRKGKVERRKKVSAVKGYTFRGGKLKRMSPTEKRNRRISQRRGKIKRKAKKTKALAKRKRSMRKLKALGGGR